MDRRTALLGLACALLACAGAAIAVPHISRSSAVTTDGAPGRQRPHHTPAPTSTPRVDQSEATADPGVVSGPEPVVERHVIHGSGNIAVVSGTVDLGTHVHGAVGTPRPSRSPRP